mmetsp:Transcript_38235/g.96867  ORF Transcript_38235/g.96867 Transcript_38235/m.96867 type:complete len:221 (-) Transcript_38235:1338-2000(-)
MAPCASGSWARTAPRRVAPRRCCTSTTARWTPWLGHLTAAPWRPAMEMAPCASGASFGWSTWRRRWSTSLACTRGTCRPNRLSRKATQPPCSLWSPSTPQRRLRCPRQRGPYPRRRLPSPLHRALPHPPLQRRLAPPLRPGPLLHSHPPPLPRRRRAHQTAPEPGSAMASATSSATARPVTSTGTTALQRKPALKRPFYATAQQRLPPTAPPRSRTARQI